MAVLVHRFGPARPWFPPGSTAVVVAEVSASGAGRQELAVELVDLDRVVNRVARSVHIGPDGARYLVPVDLPSAPRHGYGLRLRIGGSAGPVGARSAVEALDGWWESPRHAALTEFESPDRAAAAVTALADWHVTIAQAYDWMYRHYRYTPPSGDAFVDTLGRRVAHSAVHAAVRTGHRHGIATLAYGSVYGAEREYVDKHPDERVFDADGRPVSLGETFFINDLRPGGPWRRRLIGEYERAVRRFAFDGIHMDTYGPPHEAVGFDGEPVRFAELYPGLISEAARRVAAARPRARVLFNCVEGFPLESVAAAPTAALYLELWPPDERFEDIVRWIEQARAVADGRAVVIAAYAAALRSAVTPAERASAIEAAILLTSVIAAAGAYHHALAEGNRLLVEGYYPAAVRLRAAEARELQAAWRFGARHVHLLTDPAAEPIDIDGVELRNARGAIIPTSARPTAGAMWLRGVRTGEGRRVLHLVDLREQADDRWTSGRQAVRAVRGLRLRWPADERVVAMSPWTSGGDAVPLWTGSGWAALPGFRRWITVVAG